MRTASTDSFGWEFCTMGGARKIRSGTLHNTRLTVPVLSVFL
jgi:hypothetical protein